MRRPPCGQRKGDGVSLPQLAKELDIDKSAAARRWQAARRRGYLKNEEARKGRPARLKTADPLPDDVEILPAVDRLAEYAVSQAFRRGNYAPSPIGEDEVERGDLCRLGLERRAVDASR